MRPNSIVLGSVCDDDEGGRGATRAKSGGMSVENGNGPRDSGPSRRDEEGGGRGATRAVDGDGPRGSEPSRGDDVAGGRGVTRAVDERACYFRVC
jgi:hypothetical protein